MTPKIGLLVVAAGRAQRMGSIDKAWAPLGKHPVLWHSLTRLGPVADRVVLVVRPDDLDRARATLLPQLPELELATGGADRQESVANGLSRLQDVEMVAVHDAARPFAPTSLLQAGLEVAASSQAAVPVVAVADTIKQVDTDDRVIRTFPRAELRAAQTPQVFRASVLRDAYERVGPRMLATDDSGLVEAAGYRVQTFPGSPMNFKITTPLDLELARLMLREMDESCE